MYGLLLVPTTLLFLLTWWRSLAWDTIIDVPLFMYTGFLMDHFHMVPVRDFFTYNMLGTHVVFRWLYHFFGSSNLGMRLADTAILIIILALMIRMLAPFGRRVAWAGAVVFGLLHLRYGSLCYLQRDFLALVPITLMVLSATVWFRRHPRLRWLFAGLFCGTLLTIKPHLIIGGMVVFVYLIADRDVPEQLSNRQWASRFLRIALFFCLGGSLPLLWMAGYYAYYGVLGEFVRITADFFPLHADISGRRKVFDPGERLPYTLYMSLSGRPWGNFQLAMGTVCGVALLLFAPGIEKRERKLGYLLLCLVIAYAIYPCFAARFYEHHYYPFRFLSCALLAFCFRKWQFKTPLRVRLLSGSLAAFAIVSLFYADFDAMARPVESLPNSIAPPYRTQRMASWLAKRLQPGDTVQPIEWGFCGIVHAALENRVKIPTHIIWAEGLFHHISNPLVKDLRKSFMEDLTANKPRFVIRSKMEWDYITGHDCSELFEELDALLKRDYFVALDSRDFCIWESNTSPTAPEDRAHASDTGEEVEEVRWTE
jgi:hypothetical protein